MSSIILSNPFVSPVPPPSSVQENSSPTLAVAPTQNASSGNSAGDTTSFSGSGSGFSGGSDQQSAAAFIRDRAKATMARRSEATSTSVINAQTQRGEDVVAFGANLPKVEMPDPLPTSPFLISLSVRT